ncbi:hypothetical protein F4774DRAFT_409990 [Daldinia eschscholtzii]|nr:hypothetical protein F4774DRAFT_409990 [Daldinia eschscholtzii]
MLFSKFLVNTLLATIALGISNTTAMSQPEVTESLTTMTATMTASNFDLLVMVNHDCVASEWEEMSPLLGHPIATTLSNEVPMATKPANSSGPNSEPAANEPEADPTPPLNPFTEELGSYQPSIMEDMISEYNRQNPSNQIPPFVICTSIHGRPRVYNRREIWLAIQAAVHDLAHDVRSGDRSLGAAWPRRLGFQRPNNANDAAGPIMEYPIGVHEYDLPLTSLTGNTTLMRDRVTFMPDGTFTGIVRYTNDTTWHFCYPNGWHSFQRGRTATRTLFQHGVGHIRGLWNRWLGYQHGGYERLDD